MIKQFPDHLYFSYCLKKKKKRNIPWWMWKRKKKSSLKLNIQNTKIMASGPITTWQIDSENNRNNDGLFFLGFKITVDSDCSHEIKRRLLLRRKAMTNLDSVLKSRKITLTTKVCIVKAMVIPGVMNGCESWTIKKAEHQTVDTFKLW